jgi:hypothetical protein
MVAPPMGRGMATGATAAAPPAGYGPAQSAGGEGGFAGQAVFDDPATYARRYMRAHGFDPDAHTTGTDTLYRMLAKSLPAIWDMMTGGGTMPMDVLADPSGTLNNIFFAGPGSAFGKMAEFGRNQFEAMKGSIPGMTPAAQEALITARSGLETAGQNPYLQNAAKTGLERQLGGYHEFAQANAATPGRANASLWQYLIDAGLDPFAYGR